MNYVKKYLGIDWGEKRIGLALANSEVMMALPFNVVASIDEILKIVEEEEIDLIVVGAPYSIVDYKLQIAEKFEIFLNELREKITIPVKIIDERLSSKAADALVGSKKDKAPRDAVAAMLILQSYLDKERYGRNL